MAAVLRGAVYACSAQQFRDFRESLPMSSLILDSAVKHVLGKFLFSQHGKQQKAFYQIHDTSQACKAPSLCEKMMGTCFARGKTEMRTNRPA